MVLIFPFQLKRTSFFLVFLAALSVVAGILMSQATWIGRVGITFFHKEYNLLKVWWEGAAAVFVLLLVFFLVHTLLHQRLRIVTARITHFLLLLVAAGCLYLTYDDFASDFSHHLLGWRFHYGFYLFWIGWMLICLFFLFSRKKVTGPGNTPPADHGIK